MAGKLRRMVAFLCAGIAGLSVARAEFSPRWDALQAGEAVACEIRARIDEKSGMADSSLEAVNGWLARLTALVTVNTAGDGYRAEARLDGGSVFSVSCFSSGDAAVSAFFPSDHAYLTSPGQPDALSLLTRGGDALPDPAAFARAYQAAAPALFSALAQGAEPKLVKEKTSIKYAASPPSYESYSFPDGALNAAWPGVLEALLPALRAALHDQPEALAKTESWLRAAVFSGDCRVRRYLDKDGNDMGVQFSGRGGPAGDERKISLLMGYTPGTGGSLTLSLTGKGTLKISAAGRVTGQERERAATLSASWTVKDGSIDRSGDIDGSLKNLIRDGNEAWSGKITLTVKEGKTQTAWTLTPNLTFTDGGLAGPIAIQQKIGGKTALKGAVNVLLTGASAVTGTAGQDARDLRAFSDAQARAYVMEEWITLTGLMARLTAQLPEDARARLTHDLRTDSWMTGPSVPVPEALSAQPGEEEDSFVVEEDVP